MADVLEHWGVLGMKWGRRKASALASTQRPSQTEKPPENHSEDHKRVVELKKKKPSELSNNEMQAVITRANLERQYAELNKKQVSAGQKFVTDLLVNAGKQQATKFANAYAEQYGEKLLKAAGLAAKAAAKP